MKTCKTPGCQNESARASKYGQCSPCAAARRKTFNVESQRVRRDISSGKAKAHEPRKCSCGCGRDLRTGAHYRFATAACRQKAKNTRERADRKAAQPIALSPVEARKTYMPPKYVGPRTDQPAIQAVINPGVGVNKIKSTWPDWRKVNPEDIDPARAKFIDKFVDSIGRKA